MVKTDTTTVLSLRPRTGFVDTPFVRNLTARALAYIAAGYPVHFCGPSGSGKTTLALHVANQLSRPSILICGDDEFGSSDLVGGHNGFRRRKVVDNFIHSVLKTEEDVAQQWVDNRLTSACREGLILVYDEFTRSRPEANNILLSVLEERVLVLPASRNTSSYVKVHPEFVAIFTSNPEDYAGVHKSQDALRDRMVTIDLDHFDQETEIEITRARSGIPRADAERIVSLVRAYRASGLAEFAPTVRSCIMIARVVHLQEAQASRGDPIFEQTCLDVLASGIRGVGVSEGNVMPWRKGVLELIHEHAPDNSREGIVNLPLRA